MKKLIVLFAFFVLLTSHDMFLKMDSYFLKSNTAASINLYNGTFDKGENPIARTRMQDVSIMGNGNRQKSDTTLWMDVKNFSILNFKTGEAGTYVAGVSTKPNSIKLSAKDFNEYLQHDGVLDMLEWRTKNKALETPAFEQYSKHVKAIFQVGDKLTDDWKTPLGYPIEFIPLSNPYDLAVGESIQIKLLKYGQPLANQLVYAGVREKETHSHEGEGSHSHEGDKAHSHDKKADTHVHEDGKVHANHDKAAEEEHSHNEAQLTTDAEGVITLKADHAGFWFLRTINMALFTEQGFTHQSNWATLTFEVGEKKVASTTVANAAKSAENAPSSNNNLMYWGMAGLVLLLGLLWFFRSKRN